MAGIYIHIPFCKTRCIYCDFYSTTRSELKSQYIRALCRELTERKEYLKGEAVETIYFGGGTPSQLSEEDFRQVFGTIEQVYGLEHAKEITLEANPDDLTDEYTGMLSALPFNRISMGIQTFDDATLQLLNRRHNATQAIKAVERCRRAGFRNISIDLIYGLPGETNERWKQDLQQAVSLHAEHISAYHLTYEEGTPIHDMLLSHRIREVDEESSALFFSDLTDTLTAAGYEHYEISNFCQPGMYSRHNTSYWRGIPYLGCGPSAHSFNTLTREWNTASLEKYISSIEEGHREFETEYLDTATRYNECIMTALRTMWGVPMQYVEQTFGPELRQYCTDMARPYLQSGKLELKDNHLRLTREGIFVSDGIISDLMFIEDLHYSCRQ
ncbi:radical SAM family heme chaperone HemW [Bacteroides sp. UBA939]|nr:radical SAM family heme chaperone HemW [Bacteroides sp. UBA939]